MTLKVYEVPAETFNSMLREHEIEVRRLTEFAGPRINELADNLSELIAGEFDARVDYDVCRHRLRVDLRPHGRILALPHDPDLLNVGRYRTEVAARLAHDLAAMILEDMMKHVR